MHRVCVQRERSAANDKLRKLEEENQRLKRMLEQQAGNPGGLSKKRKAAAEPERPAKKPEAAEPPAKKAKNKDPGSKTPKGNGNLNHVQLDSTVGQAMLIHGADAWRVAM